MAVGTLKLVSMLATMRADGPRRGVMTSCASATGCVTGAVSRGVSFLVAPEGDVEALPSAGALAASDGSPDAAGDAPRVGAACRAGAWAWAWADKVTDGDASDVAEPAPSGGAGAGSRRVAGVLEVFWTGEAAGDDGLAGRGAVAVAEPAAPAVTEPPPRAVPRASAGR